MVHRSLALFTILVSVLLLPSVSFADTSLSITKVVADVPGANADHQYIQVINTGSDPIDLSAKTIRLVDHSGKHLIKSYNGSDTTLASGASVTIAQNPATFLSDNPNFSGALLKSFFTLTETGTVQLVQAGAGTSMTVLATKSYALVPVAKPVSTKHSSSSRGAKSASSKKTSTASKTYSSHTSYGKGITAPADAANAASAGAPYELPIPAPVLAFIQALVSCPWFAVFLGLLAFSGFSLMVIENGIKWKHNQGTAFS